MVVQWQKITPDGDGITRKCWQVRILLGLYLNFSAILAVVNSKSRLGIVAVKEGNV